ncbi:MAG: ABC-type sugar transport system, periplasmic component [Herbinix sp.]|jgi:ribose transport system substrate-binding protein|nr:ABC-type sugar transport system, periplasmic component [Herbinix sp.]
MTKAGEYSRHYVLITKDMATSFWQSVYESAKTEAAANDIYIEQIGSNLSEKYSMEDYLRISIASQVDGIIISPDESDSINELINEAADKGIPVITILNDNINTKRVSFVGLNSVELGLVYGTQIYDQITRDTRNIYILLHSSETNSMNDMIFNQIKKTLNEKLGRNYVNLQPYYISDVSEFDSEEAIRDIFVSSDIVPDMLVCMDEVDTECACQAIVDYNKVGDVTIIGSYTSDVILEAIHKKLAALTVAMDTEQLGKQSVQALLEYQEMGYVNNYYNVDLHIINNENVDSYIVDQTAD